MTYDLMIIGGGVAGTAAALAAGRSGLKVVVLEAEKLDGKPPPRPEWISARAITQLEELGATIDDCLGEPFEGIVFHSADLTRSATSDSVRPAARRVDYSALTRALRKQVTGSGGEVIDARRPSAVEASETQVVASFEKNGPISARFALYADGAQTAWPATNRVEPRWVATTRWSATNRTKDARIHWVLGRDGGRELAAWWTDGRATAACLHAPGTSEGVRQRLESLLERLQEAKLVREGRPDEIEFHAGPGQTALEMETHVGKRALRIGDAGGFVAAVSLEGIFPAMWSARLAVDTVAGALKSPHPQDALRRFSTEWRSTMADYLRPPNADMSFLLPLVFSNQQIADRLAAAFWTGENI
jgi:flavin-dependent dehydrogenase